MSIEDIQNTLKDMKYSDWFGNGNTKQDILEAVKENGVPERIYIDCNMASLVYEDKVITVGYDGNEYMHSFIADDLQWERPKDA